MDSSPKSTVHIDNRNGSLAYLDRGSWQQLMAAPAEKEHKFKTFAIVTITTDGWPDARMVVLRQADENTKKLWFHTDVRAQKVVDLRAKPEATLLFWDDTQQVQLRCRVSIVIYTDNAVADGQWVKTWEGSRKMYLSEHKPGSVQAGPYPGSPAHFGETLPTREESEAGRPNFSVIECTVLKMEYLHLSRAGQTRARFEYEGDEVVREWLAP